MLNFYETKRLILRTLDQSDAEKVLSYYERNRAFLQEWEAVKSPVFYTVEYQRNQLQRDEERIRNDQMLRLWIFKKEKPDRVIGSLAFDNIIRGAFQSCHLGYKLDEGEINQGYMTEAVRKGINIMFTEYMLHRIEANVMPKNARSLRVVQKLGFYHEGLAREYLKINGKWEDHIHMVLLNDQV